VFCFKIIICLVLQLPAISSDISEVGGHLYNLRVNLAFDRGLPSQCFSALLVKLLTHRCTIACDIKSIGSLSRNVRPCSPHYRVPTPDEHRLSLFPPGQSEIASFLSLKLQEQRRFRCVHLLVLLFSKPTREHRLARFISVALSTSSRCPEFLRRSVLECTDFPHLIFLKRDYPAALLSLIYHKLPVLPV